VAHTTLSLQIDARATVRENDPAVREEEGTLLAGLRAGEEAAYETLILRYEQPVYSIVSRLVEDLGDAPDVVQEVFLKIFRNVAGFRGESTLKTWIYRISVNEARNHHRWFGRHRRQEVGLDPDHEDHRGLRDCLADSGPGPYEITLDHETRELVEEALAEVNSNYRAALVLRELEGFSYEEIAGILEISLGTVKSRILRGREALRKSLARRMENARAPLWSLELGARGTDAV